VREACKFSKTRYWSMNVVNASLQVFIWHTQTKQSRWYCSIYTNESGSVSGRWNDTTLAVAYEHVHRNYTLNGTILHNNKLNSLLVSTLSKQSGLWYVTELINNLRRIRQRHVQSNTRGHHICIRTVVTSYIHLKMINRVVIRYSIT